MLYIELVWKQWSFTAYQWRISIKLLLKSKVYKWPSKVFSHLITIYYREKCRQINFINNIYFDFLLLYASQYIFSNVRIFKEAITTMALSYYSPPSLSYSYCNRHELMERIIESAQVERWRTLIAFSKCHELYRGLYYYT